MNKLAKICVAGIALATLGGCATAYVTPKDAADERKTNAQKIIHNGIVNDDDCNTANLAVVAGVFSQMGITPETKMMPAQEALFAFLYEERKPECVRGKTGASTTGGRYGVTPEEIARMSKVQECTHASLLLKAIEAKEVGAVVGGGAVVGHLEAIGRDCANWHEQRRADTLVAAENAIRERCSRPRFLGPHPWSNPEFYDTCRRMGFEVGPSVVQFGVTTQPLYTSGPSRRERLMERAGYDSSGQVQGHYRRR